MFSDLKFRPVLECREYRVSDIPAYLEPPSNLKHVAKMRSVLESSLTNLERRIGSLRTSRQDVADPTFTIFSKVATTGLLENTVEAFIEKHNKEDGGWITEDLQLLYRCLREWLTLHRRHRDLRQVELCFMDSESLKEHNPRSPSNVERTSQIGYSTEALEQLFNNAR